MKQDWSISIEVLHEVEQILESEWQNAREKSIRKKAAELGTWYMCGFCAGLRGEEMLLIELAGTKNGLRHLLDPATPSSCCGC